MSTAPLVIEDDYERDTNENEEMPDRLALLLPSGTFPPCADKFGLTLSEAAFAGWVKQTSPACCAASTAGAWNAVLHLERGDPRALSQDSVLDVLREIQRRRVALQKAKVERLVVLGSGDLAPLLPAIEAELIVQYPTRRIDGRKKAGTQVESKHMWFCLGVIMRREYDVRLEIERAADYAVSFAAAQPGELSPGAAASIRNSVLDRASVERGLLHATVLTLQQLMASEDRAQEKGAANDAAAANSGIQDLSAMSDAADPEEGEEGDGGDGDAEEEPASSGPAELALEPAPSAPVQDAVLLTFNMAPTKKRRGRKPKFARKGSKTKANGKGGGKGKGKGKSAKPAWRGALSTLFSMRIGLAKLNALRPSTAAFGNWAVIQSVANLTRAAPMNVNVEAKTLLGRGPKSAVALPAKKTDGVKQKTAQWDLLRSTLSEAGTALIYHLKNHYALVYATREWVRTEADLVAASAAHAELVAAYDAQQAALALKKGEEEAAAKEAIAAVVTLTAAVDGDAAARSALVDAAPASVPPPMTAPETASAAKAKLLKAPGPAPTRVVRQMLSSRRGQRPKSWIDWEEVHALFLKWTGHKIMVIRNKGAFMAPLTPAERAAAAVAAGGGSDVVAMLTPMFPPSPPQAKAAAAAASALPGASARVVGVAMEAMD